MGIFRKESNKRTVGQAISAFTVEFEEIQADQEMIAESAKVERERIMKEANEKASIQEDIEQAAIEESVKASKAINKFKDFFGV